MFVTQVKQIWGTHDTKQSSAWVVVAFNTRNKEHYMLLIPERSLSFDVRRPVLPPSSPVSRDILA